MAERVGDIMTTSVVTVQARDSVLDAACAMRDADIGAVVVMNGDQIYGILTDRDIVVRAIAEGMDTSSTRAGEVSSHTPAVMSPDDSLTDALEVMRRKAVRRLPVLHAGRLVGILSLGDWAAAVDPTSTLGGISVAPPNR